MIFLVVFMGSPKYVKSPYLRSKLSDVLREWLPQSEDTPSWRRAGMRRDVGSSMMHLFEGHPLVLEVGGRARQGLPHALRAPGCSREQGAERLELPLRPFAQTGPAKGECAAGA
jgi:hypothetical protein